MGFEQALSFIYECTSRSNICQLSSRIVCQRPAFASLSGFISVLYAVKSLVHCQRDCYFIPTLCKYVQVHTACLKLKVWALKKKKKLMMDVFVQVRPRSDLFSFKLAFVTVP